MSDGTEHTSNNQASILIKLGVHPNIISKSMDQKVFLGVITWSGYKRNVICGIIEIKNPIIEEQSLYQQSNHKLPYQSLRTFGGKLTNNLDNLFYFFLFLFLLFQIYKLFYF